MKVSNILDLVGNTPLVRLNRLAANMNAEIYLKIESNNPGFSVKDRIAKAMIEQAELEGLLNKDSVIIEPTSGNTGIGLAMVAAVKGYKIMLVMPESMSIERRKVMKAYGAEIILTPGAKGMKGAIEMAQEIKEKTPNSFMPDQFSNKANPTAHYKTTGVEIWKDSAGKVDILVTGVGTGGTISGAGKYLKEQNPQVKIIAVEPEDSPVISKGLPGSHRIQGIGAGFIPDNLDRKLLDSVITVRNEEALETARNIIREEGILCGISSGANVFAALRLAEQPENAGKVIVTTICDTGERYLSTELF